jgi:hypothetical protein
MKSAALLGLVLLTASCPSTAKPYHSHRVMAHTVHHANARAAAHANARAASHASRMSERESHSGITCDMVRAYVAQVGLAQATAIAQSAGITSAEKERARRCLAEKS